MFDFSREVFVCKCATGTREPVTSDTDAARMVFSQGRQRDLARLSPEYHDKRILADIHARLCRGEYWLIGVLGDAIVTYAFLISGPIFRYPYLPGCSFEMRADTGYGHGSWTPGPLHGRGFRRRAFVETLRVLRQWGKQWEACVFAAQRLERAIRLYSLVNIEIIPLWKVTYTDERTLVAEPLRDDDCVRPWLDGGELWME
jgi:hypothetical protein